MNDYSSVRDWSGYCIDVQHLSQVKYLSGVKFVGVVVPGQVLNACQLIT